MTKYRNSPDMSKQLLEIHKAGNQKILLFTFMAFLVVVSFNLLGTGDIDVWLQWADNVYRHGMVDGYKLNEHEHPPLMSLLLLLSVKFALLLGINPFYGIKSSLLLFLVITTIIIYFWSNKNTGLTFLSFLALLLSSMCLSYIDIYFAPFILLSFYCFSKNKVAAGIILFTIAAMIKYPPLIIAPFILVYLIDISKKSDKKSIFVLNKILIPVLVVIIPIFIVFGQEPVNALVRAFQHPRLSSQALNFNWIITALIYVFQDGRSFLDVWGNNIQMLDSPHWANIMAKILFIFFYLTCLISYLLTDKTIESLLVYCIVGHMSYFMFNIGVHENHLFLSGVLAITLACINIQFKTFAIVICAICSLNLIAF